MASTNKPARSAWSGKWAFILAAAASAVGLGNMWRFPYLAAKYGGGTFLITYLLLVFTFGVSLLLLETAFGRLTGQSAIGAFKQFGKKYAFIGVLASAVPFIITPYYCIIGGCGDQVHGRLSGRRACGFGRRRQLLHRLHHERRRRSFLWMLVFMAIVFAVVSLGVKGGIEKANLFMMPALIVMAVGIAVYTLTMPGALDGALYYLVPDFSKFSPEARHRRARADVLQPVAGHGHHDHVRLRYLDRKSSLTQSVVRIGGFDVGVSFLAGLMIVPAAFVAMGSGEAVAANSGPSLMFVTLPAVFADMGGAATVIGFLFFLLVLFAALTSAISLTETCVSIVQDGAGWSRKKSLLVIVAVVVVSGVFVNLGYNGLSFIEPLGAGSSLLDFFDFLSNSVIMPIVALLTCVFVGWVVKPDLIVKEVEARARSA